MGESREVPEAARGRIERREKEARGVATRAGARLRQVAGGKERIREKGNEDDGRKEFNKEGKEQNGRITHRSNLQDAQVRDDKGLKCINLLSYCGSLPIIHASILTMRRGRPATARSLGSSQSRMRHNQ